MLTGNTINAQQALEMGLVSSVVPSDLLLPKAMEIASQIAANPSRTVRLTKRLLRESLSMPLATSLEMAAAYQALAHYTDDHNEAVASFLEKRAPKFKGA
ncbi:MAG: enoyl-CoA hydratase-related protein, partial [Comamonas sp.]